MNHFIIFISTFLILSCNDTIDNTQHNQNQTTDSINQANLPESDFVANNNFKNDSIKYDSLVKLYDYSKWYTFFDFYPVYRYRDSSIGIIYDLSLYYDYNHPIEILNKYETSIGDFEEKISHPIDSYQQYKIYPFSGKQKFKNFNSVELHIICTKGICKSRVTDIVYLTDIECTSQLIFKLNNIDFKKYGEPILAMYKTPEVEYISNSSYKTELKKYHLEMISKADYFDSFQPIPFAKQGNLIFTYSDDFKWKNDQSKVNFPTRSVLKLEKSQLKHFWAESIDLFGVPCD